MKGAAAVARDHDAAPAARRVRLVVDDVQLRVAVREELGGGVEVVGDGVRRAARHRAEELGPLVRAARAREARRIRARDRRAAPREVTRVAAVAAVAAAGAGPAKAASRWYGAGGAVSRRRGGARRYASSRSRLRRRRRSAASSGMPSSPRAIAAAARCFAASTANGLGLSSPEATIATISSKRLSGRSARRVLMYPRHSGQSWLPRRIQRSRQPAQKR